LRNRTLALTSLIALAAAVSQARPVSAGAARAGRCTAEYGYAGVVGPRSAAGVSARLTELDTPVVRWGHVAAWVGLSSGGAGSWIQAGLAGFEEGASTLYYEVGRASATPVYTPLRYDIPSNEPHQVAVLEVPGRPGSWRIWVDGEPASPVIALAGSHASWHPMVMAESWNGGTGACNRFRFAFANLRTVAAAGGALLPLGGAPSRVDGGLRLRHAGTGLVASGTF
jgi:hypothetical protein